MEKFKGIFTALLTPFDKQQNINYDSLKKLIEFNLQQGVNGFYVCGSTGESMLMSTAERIEILKFVAREARNRATLIGHVGTISTMDAIKMAQVAADCGYDAISAVAPFYYGFSYQSIKEYYLDIVSHVNLPMIIYNFPNSGGFSFTQEFAEDFFKDERFIGIKHTSPDLYSLERFKKMEREIVVYNGYDEMLLAGLSMGADGGIGSTYNFMAHKFIAIYQNFKAGKIDVAQAIQFEVNDITAQLIKYGVFNSEKEILTNLGIPMGECRKPFLPLSDEGKKQMKIIAEKIKGELK